MFLGLEWELLCRVPTAGPVSFCYPWLTQVCERNTDTPPNVITVERFLSGEDKLQVLQYKRDSDEARADSLAMALMATEERVWKDLPYDILGNNCEHFTHFCRVGKKFSVQVCTVPHVEVGN